LARQQRQLSFITEFSSDIRHTPGQENVVADALSQPPPAAAQQPLTAQPISPTPTAEDWSEEGLHRKKKVREFPVPSRDVTTKLSLGGNNDVITELFLPRGNLVSDILAGDGNSWTFFYGLVTPERPILAAIAEAQAVNFSAMAAAQRSCPEVAEMMNSTTLQITTQAVGDDSLRGRFDRSVPPASAQPV
jgi:hypothetical protein